MEYKVSELEGALLDAAVAKAEGEPFMVESYPTNPPKPAACWLLSEEGKPLFPHGSFDPGSDWGVGGPIIEREIVALERAPIDQALSRIEWRAEAGPENTVAWGLTPLIAAMRAYVASKFGETVDLP